MKRLFVLLIIVLFVFSAFAQNPVTLRTMAGAWEAGGLEAADWYGMNLPRIPGTWYFVDPTSGNAAWDGLTKSTAVASIVTAYGKCTSGAGDGIVVMSRGTTTAGTSSYLSATITWSKHGITVVGLCAPTWYNQRARIASASGVATLTSLITVTGNNNAFINLLFYNAHAGSAQNSTVKVTGVRNAFINCDFKGTPAAADAYKCDLWLSGADETLFKHCNFGNASYDAGDNAACHVYIDGTTGNGQNYFENCTSVAQVSAGTAFGVLKSGAATALNGIMIFKDCIFTAWRANTGDPALATWFIGTAPTTGTICVQNSGIFGYDEWDSAAGNDRVYVVNPTSAANAGGGIATVK